MPKNDKVCGQALQVFRHDDGHFRIQLDIIVSDMAEAKAQTERLTKIVEENSGDDNGVVALNKDNFMSGKGPGLLDSMGVIPVLMPPDNQSN